MTSNNNEKDDTITKLNLPSYLPPPAPQNPHNNSSSIIQSPKFKKQKLNLPTPVNMNNKRPSSPQNILTPTKMDQHAMDIHYQKQRQSSLEDLVRKNLMDEDEDETKTDTMDTDEKKDNDNIPNNPSDLIVEDRLICLVNNGSGAKKGWILSQELKKYDTSVYNMKDLSKSDIVRQQLGMELYQLKKKCIVLICGGDGSQAWGASLIDQSIEAYIDKHAQLHPNDDKIDLPFPTFCVFPMGTGNDLCRSLGWGSIEPNHKNLLQYIADIHFCKSITKREADLDRWRCTYTFDDIIENDTHFDNMSNVPSPDDRIDNDTIDHIMNDIDNNSSGNLVNANKEKAKQINDMFNMSGSHAIPSVLPPPKQWYIQNHASSQTYKKRYTFDPPLPSTFICYLSIGYDALVAWKFEQDRRLHPDRYNNQIKNQVMYVKHGFTEFFKPSEPINDCVDVIIDNKIVDLPQACRSLKVININSAMNGLFFWGTGKSRDFEYQSDIAPRLNDGKIEVMGTRGVHDMIQYRVNVSHAQRISQTEDVTIRFKKVPKQGIALQIDGEAWIIKEKCSLHIQIHDKIPTVIGYTAPRGVDPWLLASLEDQTILKAKEAFRKSLRMKYNQPLTPRTSDYENESDSPQSSPAPPNKDGSDDDKEKITGNIIMDKIINSSLNNIFNIKPNHPKPQAVEMKKMSSPERKQEVSKSPSPSTPNKHIPNIPFFDTKKTSPDFMQKRPSMNNDNSGNKFMDKLKNGILNKSRRNSLNSPNRNSSSPSPSPSEEKGQENESAADVMQVDIKGYVQNHPEIKKDKKNILNSSIFSPKKDDKTKKNGNSFNLDRFTWWKVTRAKNNNKSIDAEAAHDAISSDEKHHDDLRKTKSFTVIPRSKRSASLF